MGVRVHLTINTVSNPGVGTRTAKDYILTPFKGNAASCSSQEYSAIHTFCDLKTIHIDSNVDVGVFTADNSDVFAWSSVGHISHCHTFIEECNVLWLVKLVLQT